MEQMFHGCRTGSLSQHCLLRLQEDAHNVVLNLVDSQRGFFGVFDGHDGKDVAKFSVLHLVMVPPAFTMLLEALTWSAALAEDMLHERSGLI